MYLVGSLSTWILVRNNGNLLKEQEKRWGEGDITVKDTNNDTTECYVTILHSKKIKTCVPLAKRCSFYTIKTSLMGSARLCTYNIQNDGIIWVKLKHHYHQINKKIKFENYVIHVRVRQPKGHPDTFSFDT